MASESAIQDGNGIDVLLVTNSAAATETMRVKGTSGAIHVLEQGSSSAAGDVAHDSADSGNPVKIGGKAKETDGTDPGSVAEDDRVDAIFDRNGRQLVNTAHPNLWKSVNNYAAAQTNTQLKAAPGAGLSYYITDIFFSFEGAGSVKIVEDESGTPVDVWEVSYFAANGGASVPLNTPIKLTANKSLGITTTGAVNHSVNLTGFIAP